MAELDFEHNEAKPPRSSAVGHRITRRNEDTARYLITPDADFARPYLRIPNGPGFVWPLGAEGFEVRHNATLGIHKYLGDVDIDVDITHRDEMHIQMTGIFPGWTSTSNMSALRQICAMDTPEKGKVLHLPKVLPHLNYVTCEDWSFSHDIDDHTEDIAYTISMIRVGVGPKASGTPPPDVSGGSSAGGGSRTFTVTSSVNTLRKIALFLFQNANRWTDLYVLNHNYFDNFLEMPTYRVPDAHLPEGLELMY